MCPTKEMHPARNVQNPHIKNPQNEKIQFQTKVNKLINCTE